MNIKIAALALLCVTSFASAGVVSGTNIDLGASGDTIILTGTTPAVTGIATGGWFTAGFDVAGAIASNNFASLVSNFHVLASGQLGGDDALGPGYKGNYLFSNNYVLGTDVALGTVLYTFIGNAANLSSSTLFALIQHTETVGPDSPSPDSNNLNFGNGTVLIGQKGTTTYNFGGGNVSTPSLTLVAAIPEPSTLLLGAVGALGLLRRRR